MLKNALRFALRSTTRLPLSDDVNDRADENAFRAKIYSACNNVLYVVDSSAHEQPKLRTSGLRHTDAEATIILQEINRHGSHGSLTAWSTAHAPGAHLRRNHAKTVNHECCLQNQSMKMNYTYVLTAGN
jgi:hypothetical protein